MMKLGRNDPCTCGSGKKYKRCCMSAGAKQHAEVSDEVEQLVAMNPNLTLDDLNAVLQHKMHEHNNHPNPDFCGLSSTQMANWLYAPFNELNGVSIATPEDLRLSPVMRYLALILDEAMQNNASFKATGKGNLPAKLVKQASDLLPEFALAQYQTYRSISEFAGSNEDKFNALHYTRILAEIAGIIHRSGGYYHVEQATLKQYQSQGINAFFKPMLEVATTKYNWEYLDSLEFNVDLRTFWVFILWRLQSHSSVEQLIDEVATAFPDVLRQIPEDHYCSPQKLLSFIIESRFIERFLQFWGFVIMDPKRVLNGEPIALKVQVQPLLKHAFEFSV